MSTQSNSVERSYLILIVSLLNSVHRLGVSFTPQEAEKIIPFIRAALANETGKSFCLNLREKGQYHVQFSKRPQSDGAPGFYVSIDKCEVCYISTLRRTVISISNSP